MSDRKLLAVFAEYYRLYLQPVKNICVIRLLNRECQIRLKGYFNDNFTDKDLGLRLLNLLTAPERLSIDALEEIEFQKIIKLSSGKPLRIIHLLLRKHLQKYLWLPVSYNDEKEWDLAYLENRLKAVQRKVIDPAERIKEIRFHVAGLKQRKKEAIKKYRIESDIVYLCQLVAWGAYFKDFLREAINMGHYYSRPLFFEMAKRAGYSFKEIKCLGYGELLSIFKPSIVLKNNITRRQRKFILARIAGKRIELYAKEADKFLKHNFFRDGKREIIKGTGVSLSQARGKVIIVKKQSVISGKKGYVLVTTMTTPELLPLMKNAVAVVTDEGGLTCHAAIISRELKIPCIVGTRIATTMLKDGDKVEVDADKGLVKKL